jgi:hypothetical protein
LGHLQTLIVHGMLLSMAVISRTVATLRIIGEDLDPYEVTRLLGIEPTAQARKGEPNRSGYPGQPGIWRLSATEQAPGDLNTQIVELLAKITSDPSVWAHLTQKFRCDIFCGLFMQDGNEGEQLEPATLAMLGSRGLQLGLDIYGAGD